MIHNRVLKRYFMKYTIKHDLFLITKKMFKKSLIASKKFIKEINLISNKNLTQFFM